MIRPESSHGRLERAIAASQSHLLNLETTADSQDRPLPHGSASELGYWIGELEADTTLESDYILFLYFLDPEAHREKIRKLANYIASRQLADGTWNIYPGGPGEISASVKAYFALKLAGRPVSDPLMVRAREAILGMGGADRVNSYTKIYLSFLNQVDWKDCPAIPPEIVLLPRFFYFNIYEMSYWSRAIVIPLSILYARQPKREVPPEATIEEIFAAGDGPSGNGDGTGEPLSGAEHDVLGSNGDRAAEASGELGNRRNGKGLFRLRIPRDPNLFSWRSFFLLVDRLLKIVEKTPMKPFRNLALRQAEKWMVARLEDSDGLGAIFPAMVNSVMALKSLGYEDSHPKVAEGIEKLRELEIEEGDAIRLQPCLSPIWDTALAMNALEESGVAADHPAMLRGARWLVSKEARRSGDWQVRKPNIEASGWYFQFKNEFYPDVDDTAAVLMALERADLDKVAGGPESLKRGVDWMLSLQCSNGGWAAFDVDVDHEVLTKVPFADHNAMLDPACADITGRVLEMLGRFPDLRRQRRVRSAIAKAVEFMVGEQDESGAWYGRWGVNYIYGTCHALKGLASVGVDLRSSTIRRAVEWLEGCQNDDGGWGESCHSYADPSTKGQGTSTASQTSWAVLGLIAAGEARSRAVSRGIRYLLDRQNPDGTWDEDAYTGTGFPCVFYLKYHLYSQYFPLFALGAYRRALREPEVEEADREAAELTARVE